MKTWFDEKRVQMLNAAITNVLSPQVQGPLSCEDIIQLCTYLESLNTPALSEHAKMLSTCNIDMLDELEYVTMSEAVALFDSETTSKFMKDSEKEYILDLSKTDNDVDLTPISYWGTI